MQTKSDRERAEAAFPQHKPLTDDEVQHISEYLDAPLGERCLVLRCTVTEGRRGIDLRPDG